MVGVIGMLVNDSGVVILSVSLSLATPLMLAAGVRSLELDLRNEDTARPGSARSATSVHGTKVGRTKVNSHDRSSGRLIRAGARAGR